MTDDADYWKNDLLNRKEDAQLLHQFLVRRMLERQEVGRTGSYVLNLDAGWGHGKSFFLSGLKLMLEKNNHKVVLVNAWEDDYADDPLLAVVRAIKQAFPSGKGETAAKNLAIVGAKITAVGMRHGARALFSHVIGSAAVDEIVKAGGAFGKGGTEALRELLDASTDAAGKALLSQFEEGKAAVSEFRATLRKLIATSKLEPPLFILIDEVDRCRPSYAITLLERVKHLFEVDGVVFVIATDTQQLRHSVSAVYGAGFDGKAYLLRFFDRTYRFATPTRDLLIKKHVSESGIDMSLLSSPTKDNHHLFITNMADYFDLNPRELDRCFDVLQSVTTMWPPRQWRLQLLYLVPLIVGYCRNDELFSQLATLNAGAPFIRTYERAPLTITFDKIDDFGRKQGQESHQFSDVLANFLQIARKPVREILKMERSRDGMAGWVKRQFIDEAQQLRDRVEFVSATEYPDLVRRVARLSENPK
jgi:hypothetical protein